MPWQRFFIKLLLRSKDRWQSYRPPKLSRSTRCTATCIFRVSRGWSPTNCRCGILMCWVKACFLVSAMPLNLLFPLSLNFAHAQRRILGVIFCTRVKSAPSLCAAAYSVLLLTIRNQPCCVTRRLRYRGAGYGEQDAEFRPLSTLTNTPVNQ